MIVFSQYNVTRACLIVDSCLHTFLGEIEPEFYGLIPSELEPSLTLYQINQIMIIVIIIIMNTR